MISFLFHPTKQKRGLFFFPVASLQRRFLSFKLIFCDLIFYNLIYQGLQSITSNIKGLSYETKQEWPLESEPQVPS